MKKWFKGKDIALVGNARSLLDKSSPQGTQIDSHEVVVRLNKSYRMLPPRTSQFVRTHGKRIDVLFVNLVRTVNLIQRPYPETKVGQVTHCDIPERFKEVVDFIIPEEINRPIMDLCPMLDEKRRAKPSVGLRVLNYISLCDPASVTLYGFDWKKTPSYWGMMNVVLTSEHAFEFERQYCLNNFLNKNNYHLK